MDQKKTYALIMVAVLLVLSVGTYMVSSKNKIPNPKESIETADEIKFKKEYESYNGKKREGQNYQNLEMKIPVQNKIVYNTASEIVQFLKTGTGVVYFGFPTCPWCRNAVPLLIDVAKEEGLKEIQYFNALTIRDTKHLDPKGSIVTDKAGTKEYEEIVRLLQEYLPSYEGLEDDSIKRLYFPTVVFVKEGKIMGIHEGTVDSQKDPSVPLNKKQIEELTNIYIKGISDAAAAVCEKKC